MAAALPGPPGPPQPEIRNLNGWNLSFCSRPISSSERIDHYTQATGIRPPEMVFLENHLTIEHPGVGLRIRFTAGDALLHCRLTEAQKQQQKADAASSPSPAPASAPPTPQLIKCKSAHLWKDKLAAAHAREGIEQLELDYDWTYTTLYAGTVEPVAAAGAGGGFSPWERAPNPINLPLLMRRDPILWFASLVLFEDELHDNGVSQLLLKARAMPTCWLVLLRFWLRVDDVLVRVYDTRLFVEFGKPELIREQQLREASAEELRRMGIPANDPMLNDPDQLARRLPLRHQRRERIVLRLPSGDSQAGEAPCEPESASQAAAAPQAKSACPP